MSAALLEGPLDPDNTIVNHVIPFLCYSFYCFIFWIIYLIFCSTWDFDFGYHNECQDSKLDSSWFSLAKDDDDPNGGYSDAGLMDLWVWFFVLRFVSTHFH